MIPKHIITVFYKHHENHNNLLEVFKDYIEKMPCIQFKYSAKKGGCCILPINRGIEERVLHYLDDGINNIDYFQWDIFEYHYNPFSRTHTYYALMLGGRTECGLIFSPRMEFTLDYMKKIEALSKD